MSTFAVIADHPPNLCPTSNAQTKKIMKEGAGQIPQLAEKLINPTYSMEEALALIDDAETIF